MSAVAGVIANNSAKSNKGGFPRIPTVRKKKNPITNIASSIVSPPSSTTSPSPINSSTSTPSASSKSDASSPSANTTTTTTTTILAPPPPVPVPDLSKPTTPAADTTAASPDDAPKKKGRSWSTYLIVFLVIVLIAVLVYFAAIEPAMRGKNPIGSRFIPRTISATQSAQADDMGGGVLAKKGDSTMMIALIIVSVIAILGALYYFGVKAGAFRRWWKGLWEVPEKVAETIEETVLPALNTDFAKKETKQSTKKIAEITDDAIARFKKFGIDIKEIGTPVAKKLSEDIEKYSKETTEEGRKAIVEGFKKMDNIKFDEEEWNKPKETDDYKHSEELFS